MLAQVPEARVVPAVGRDQGDGEYEREQHRRGSPALVAKDQRPAGGERGEDG